MKNLLLLALLLFPSVLGVVAQEMPPPPPLIYSAPLESEIKEFTSEADKFKISFPGIPSIEEVKDGQVNSRIYKFRRKGSNSILHVLTFSANVEDQKSEFVKRYKENILNAQSGIDQASFPQIYYEKQLEVEGNRGVEIAYSISPLVFEVIRLVFVQNRVFQIKTDVTNWHILTKYHKNKVADFEKETERFFSSFKALE